METKEFLYTRERYLQTKIDPFLAHVEEYLVGEKTVPVSQTITLNESVINFTFSNRLLRCFQEEDRRILKAYEVAMKYGFRGYSDGGKNGIFSQRRQDTKMVSQTDDFIKEMVQPIIEDLDISNGGLDVLHKIKTVYHDPSGERVVGVFNPENNRAIFLGFACY